jgi:hypothetical protein
MTWELLPSCYDIDTKEDLVRLKMDLQAVTGENRVLCSRTREALAVLSTAIAGDTGILKSR